MHFLVQDEVQTLHFANNLLASHFLVNFNLTYPIVLVQNQTVQAEAGSHLDLYRLMLRLKNLDLKTVPDKERIANHCVYWVTGEKLVKYAQYNYKSAKDFYPKASGQKKAMLRKMKVEKKGKASLD